MHADAGHRKRGAGAGFGVQHDTAIRHAIFAQGIELRHTQLQSVITEQVGDNQVELRLFPFEHIPPRR